MNAEQVVQKIISDANLEAEKIIRQSEEKIATEKTKLQAELDRYHTETNRLAQSAANDIRQKILANTRMDIAKDRLAAKRRILDEVFVGAAEKIKRLPDNEYRDLIKKLIKQTVETGNEEILVGAGEKRIDAELIRQVNSEQGKWNLKLAAERAEIKAGFVVRRGKVRINMSLEVLLKQAREQLETELAKYLFDGK